MSVFVSTLPSLRLALDTMPAGTSLVLSTRDDPRLSVMVNVLAEVFLESDLNSHPVVYEGFVPERAFYSQILAQYLESR